MVKISTDPVQTGCWDDKVIKSHSILWQVTDLCRASPPFCVREADARFNNRSTSAGLHWHLGGFTKDSFEAIFKTCSQLTRDLWKDHPYQEFIDHLLKAHQSPCAQGLGSTHIFLLMLLLLCFQDRVSCVPGRPWTHYAAKDAYLFLILLSIFSEGLDKYSINWVIFPGPL